MDWRGSIIREGKRLGREKKLDVNWEDFADAWRAGYRPAMARVRSGELPWTRIDDLHRMILDDILRKFAIRGLSGDEIGERCVWHRLRGPARGLRRLKKRYVIGTLSNGNVGLLVNMAKNAGLPWDVVFSAESFHHYKPDPETYLGAADLLGCAPGEVMLVAAHKDDLFAAKACGLRTAFVRRPLEYGPAKRADLKAERAFDFNVDDFSQLADRLCGRSGAR